MFTPFTLNRTLTRGLAADPDDISMTQRALGRLGHFEAPDFGQADNADATRDALFKGIEAFQKQNNLAVDGVINPNGETARALNAALAPQGATRAAPTPAPSPINPDAIPISIIPEAVASNWWIESNIWCPYDGVPSSSGNAPGAW